MSLTEAAAKGKAQMEKLNPTVGDLGAPKAARTRIPMSVPQRKLEVPEIPGFYMKWFRGTPQRLAQAERAGFVYVGPEEIALNNVSLGGDASKQGNTDMGSRVSIAEGMETDGSGNAIRLYLMKQPLEFFSEDQAILQDRNDDMAKALTASFREGTVGVRAAGAPQESAEDVGLRYVGKAGKAPSLFTKKSPKR